MIFDYGKINHFILYSLLLYINLYKVFYNCSFISISTRHSKEGLTNIRHFIQSMKGSRINVSKSKHLILAVGFAKGLVQLAMPISTRRRVVGNGYVEDQPYQNVVLDQLLVFQVLS